MFVSFRRHDTLGSYHLLKKINYPKSACESKGKNSDYANFSAFHGFAATSDRVIHPFWPKCSL